MWTCSQYHIGSRFTLQCNKLMSIFKNCIYHTLGLNAKLSSMTTYFPRPPIFLWQACWFWQIRTSSWWQIFVRVGLLNLVSTHTTLRELDCEVQCKTHRSKAGRVQWENLPNQEFTLILFRSLHKVHLKQIHMKT